MSEIFHIIPIQALKIDIYTTLVTESSLKKWWLPNASTNGKIGSIANFPLSTGKGVIQMEILDLIPENRVYWKCLHHLNKRLDWNKN
jgi:hypothetical protein